MVEAEPQFHLSLSQDIFLIKVRAGRLNLWSNKNLVGDLKRLLLLLGAVNSPK